MTDDQQEHSTFEEETLSTIEALQHQEKEYSCVDYCQLHADKTPSRTLQTDRKLMLKWSYNVIDYFNLNRETATIAMNYSDRFLQTDKGHEYLNDTDMYQLLCIVSLYLAIKVHESSTLTLKVLVNIGHGNYTVEQMEKMERLLLSTLEWRVNPPTSLSFVRLFLDLMCYDLDHSTTASAYMLARAQTERAVGDYKLLKVLPSQIAYASVVNALEALGYNECDRLSHLFPEDFLQKDLNPLRIRLCSAISWESSLMTIMPRNTSSQKTTARTKAQVDAEESTTPRSVLCHTITSRQ